MPRQIQKRSKTIESRRNDPLLDNLNQTPPEISLPWPPIVTADDFVRNRPISKVDIKSPNSFFVYRTAFVKQLLIEQHKFKMTQVSKWASTSWRKESKEVKDAYRVMAQKIDKEFQERRKAIKGYRIVCENFPPTPKVETPSDSEEEHKSIKQEPIEEIPPQPKENQRLIDWQQYFPCINVNTSPESSSDTLSDYTVNNSPISPISPDPDFSLLNNNTDNIRVYLPTYNENLCINPVFNADPNAEVHSPVKEEDTIWNQTDESSNASTVIEESNYYNSSGYFIESYDYLPWD